MAALEQIRQEYNQWIYHAQPGHQRVYRSIKKIAVSVTLLWEGVLGLCMGLRDLEN